MYVKYLISAYILMCVLSSCTSTNNGGFSKEEINNLRLEKSPVYATQTESAKVIDLNSSFDNIEQNIDDLLDTLYFLPLQTDADCVFHGIFKIKVSSDRIFIRDYNDRFLIFDGNGKFIKEIMPGQGPGEISQLYDFAYNEKSQTLVIAKPAFLSFYDKDGNFITDKRCPIIPWDLAMTDYGFIFVQPQFANSHLGDNARYSVIITNNEFEVTGRGVNIGHSEGLVRVPFHLFENQGAQILSLPGNDTIYEVSGADIRAKYVLNFDDYETYSTGDGVFSNNDKYYYMSGYMENSKTQLFDFHSPDKGSYNVYWDKSTNKSISAIFFYSSEGVVPFFCSRVLTVFDDYFVSYMNPETGMQYSSPAISEEDNAKVRNLTEEDNPVLMFFKFKTIE